MVYMGQESLDGVSLYLSNFYDDGSFDDQLWIQIIIASQHWTFNQRSMVGTKKILLKLL